jgi:RNA recognition motif-containing protein
MLLPKKFCYHSSESVSIAFGKVVKFFLLSSQSDVSLKTGLERSVTIYVGNLSFQASEDDLREVFAEYGEVSRISLPTDRETGRKRGFAFVEMKDESQEDLAISELDGAEWLGRELKVNKAKPREDSRGSGGGKSLSNSPY